MTFTFYYQCNCICGIINTLIHLHILKQYRFTPHLMSKVHIFQGQMNMSLSHVFKLHKNDKLTTCHQKIDNNVI